MIGMYIGDRDVRNTCPSKTRSMKSRIGMYVRDRDVQVWIEMYSFG